MSRDLSRNSWSGDQAQPEAPLGTRSNRDTPASPLDTMSKLMKIGELARKTGKTSRALHLYEEMGLLLPRRSAGGFRLYGADELARVYWISKLQDMGFKLSQIQGLLGAVRASRSAPGAMDGVRELFQGKLEETRAAASRLKQLERDLAESLAYLEECRVCDESSTSACVTCEHETAERNQPQLVSGLHLTRLRDQNSGVST